MAYEVIVLGGSGTFPAPGSACSGYLFKTANTRLWIDCGPGSFGNLQRHVKPADLTAIVLSHLHLDHVVDLYPFLYALRYAPDHGEPAGLPVYAPPGAPEFLGGLLGGDPTFGGYLSFVEIDVKLIPDIGDFELRFCRTRHPVECYAVRATADSRTVVYTADTGPSRPVVDFAWGANLLIAEASLQKTTKEQQEVHMTAGEAGEMAFQCQVAHLLLTHLVPGLDPTVSKEMAAREYRGEIDVAADNLRILVY